MRQLKGRVLIVAGSDSGGGAGIQADIKAVSALGAYAMTAITALTVQNTQGVFAIHAAPLDIIDGQMRVVLEDLGADAIKTGMLHSVEVIETVAARLASHAPGVPLVADPVMVAKGGARLLEDNAVDALKTLLLPRAALVTPNIPEAEGLTGRTIESTDDMIAAGRQILELGPGAVLVKGGHGGGAEIDDVLVTAEGDTQILTHPRFDTVHTHGTGCTLASAIAAGLAQGMPGVSAVQRAKDYVIEAIRTAPGFGQGYGPLNHMHVLPVED